MFCILWIDIWSLPSHVHFHLSFFFTLWWQTYYYDNVWYMIAQWHPTSAYKIHWNGSLFIFRTIASQLAPLPFWNLNSSFDVISSEETMWQKSFKNYAIKYYDRLGNIFAGVIPVSGVFDVRPLVRTTVNDPLKLTE